MLNNNNNKIKQKKQQVWGGVGPAVAILREKY